jgi:hypothetical protein
VASLGEPGLKDVALQAETNIRRVEQEREGDERLSGAKEVVRDLNGPTAMPSTRSAKIAYVLYLLDERGKLPKPREKVSRGRQKQNPAWGVSRHSRRHGVL